MLTRPRILTIISISLIAITTLAGWGYYRRSALDRELAERRQQAARANLIEANLVPLPAIKSQNIKFFQRAVAVRDLVRHGQTLFAATEGGLIEFDNEGRIKRHYTTAQGLPENDLTTLASYQGQLFLGSKSGKLVVFNGESFAAYQFAKFDPQRVNSMAVLKDQLAINSGAGVVLFNGEAFSQLRDLTSRDTGSVTATLERAQSDYLGTFAKGLWVRREGNWLHAAGAEDLLSDRVVNIAAIDDQVFIGTDLGITKLGALDRNGERFSTETVAPLPDLSDLIAYHNRLYACRSNGELFSTESNVNNNERVSLIPLERRWPETRHCRFKVIDDNLFLLTDNGIWINNGSKSFQDFRRFDARPAATLSDNMVAALAVDREDRIWVGLFSHGIDIISPAGELLKHIESDTIREVNSLRWDNENSRMLAATSGGLFEFDLQLHERAIIKPEDMQAERVLSNNISQVNLIPAAVFSPYRKVVEKVAEHGSTVLGLANARGFTIGADGAYQNYTTLQGLPSNSVYTSASINSRLFVGTLGGLAVIEGGRVTRSYHQSNSQLSTNWVTALYPYNNSLFIGTYGGGLSQLTPTGEIRSLNGEIKKFAVNLNAITAERGRLFIGTLADGCLSYDLDDQRWYQLKQGLPSVNVMATVVSEKYLFIGTEQGLARVERGALAELMQSIEPKSPVKAR